jgi:hypothetical protein
MPGMSSSRPDPDPRATSVCVSDQHLTVDLVDGRRIVVPTAWFPRLAGATPAQRDARELLGDGRGVRWPEVDEDLSVEGLLRGAPAPGSSGRTG